MYICMYVCIFNCKEEHRTSRRLTYETFSWKSMFKWNVMSSFPNNVVWKKAEREVNESIKKEFQIVFIMVNVICASVPFVFFSFFCNVTFVLKKYKNMLVHEKHIYDIIYMIPNIYDTKCILRNISIETRNLLDIDSI